jgi:hypothetical protein
MKKHEIPPQHVILKDSEHPFSVVYKPLTVAEVVAYLQKWPDDTPVYVDFDREGGNESQARHVVPINEYGCNGVKIE